jgi:hypothetical protein
MRASVTWDTRDFDAGILRWEREYHAAMVTGMGRAAAMLLKDAKDDIPTVPQELGNLRGSGSVFVNNELVVAEREAAGTPAMSDHVAIGAGEIIARVGFNTVYAAVQHEGRWETGPLAGVEIQKYTTPGSGKFFLLEKMARYHDRYIRAAVAYARNRMGM